jgi:hypothetical protein
MWADQPAGPFPVDGDSRIRGTYGEEGEGTGPERMLLEVYDGYFGSWATGLLLSKDPNSENVFTHVPNLIIDGSAQFPFSIVNTITPQTPGMTTFGSPSGNVPLYLNGPVKSRVTTSAAINTTETYISIAQQYMVPYAGMTVRFTIYGTCTSTAGNTNTFRVRAGSGTIADPIVYTATFTAATTGTNVPFKIEIVCVLRTFTNGTDTVFSSGDVINEGVTGIVASETKLLTSASGTFNTSGSSNFGVTYQASAATTTCTFQNVIVELVK